MHPDGGWVRVIRRRKLRAAGSEDAGDGKPPLPVTGWSAAPGGSVRAERPRCRPHTPTATLQFIAAAAVSTLKTGGRRPVS
jgi:hypothetical protein